MKHCGVIDSDAVVNRYQRQYDDMVKRYRVEAVRRTPLFRRLLRWVQRRVHEIVS